MQKDSLTLLILTTCATKLLCSYDKRWLIYHIGISLS